MRIVQAVFGSLLIAAALPPTVALAAANLYQEERVDLRLITALRDEALNRSQAQKTLGVLTDEIGPRLTGSPAFRHAAEWTQSQLSSWGLQNVHAESFAPFGRSWTFDKASLRMVAPLPLDIVAIPKAWTSGTHGVQRGKLVFAKLSSDEELAKWKGKLAGRIVLLDEPAVIAPHLKGDASRYSEQELSDLTKMDLGEAQSRHGDIAAYLKKLAFRKKLLGFLSEEKVLAVLNRTRGEDGTIFVQDGGSYKKGDPESPPDLVVMTETYDRLYRLVEKKKDVELDVDVKADFGNEDPQAVANVFADIPGTDKKDEFVMLGAHLDSWHGGTGATDNGAGVAVVMEAVRMLKAVGFVPRRTIRVALWGGEEQGLIGSRAYVNQWVASRPDSTDPKEKDLPSFARKLTWPLTLKPMQSKISVYFNLDNGAGKIRGIYAENNVAVKPIFDAWLAPFHDLGASTTTLRPTGSTDHVSFDRVGVPGFQFIQDEMDYMSRTHHSNMDVYDKVQKNDLTQAALIMASFVAHAANRDDMLPRKPLPRAPLKEDKKDEDKNDLKDSVK